MAKIGSIASPSKHMGRLAPHMGARTGGSAILSQWCPRSSTAPIDYRPSASASCSSIDGGGGQLGKGESALNVSKQVISMIPCIIHLKLITCSQLRRVARGWTERGEEKVG